MVYSIQKLEDPKMSRMWSHRRDGNISRIAVPNARALKSIGVAVHYPDSYTNILYLNPLIEVFFERFLII